MLASILPGARELRTPLAVGICLGAIVWIRWGDAFPTEAEATGFLARAYDTFGALGATVTLAVASFVCYLFGSLYVGIVGQAIKRFVSLSQRRQAAILQRHFMRELDAHLRRVCEKNQLSDSERGRLSESFDLRAADGERALTTPESLRPRLLVASRDLYDEMDREESEADLRLNLALPVAVLSVALAFEWTPWALFGVVVAVLLFWQGMTKLFASRAVIVTAISHEIIQSPIVEQRKREIDEIVEAILATRAVNVVSRLSS
ncbi:hypothetical protein OMK64_01685 [Cellulomonas fimi]|uniref:hypothetical protein n=1 Tax=Cellulomonas fimi TaxID=1708 RepID=UPI00234D223D|nr:hypothetical protein [Cellulomonas fimi]MDC7120243.1 hypothetical protein [Cellulomonas fimi]